MKDLMTPQPPPIRTAQSQPILTDEFLLTVQPKVAEALAARKEFGLQKYGTVLKTHNGRDPMIDALQEGLDMIVYLRQGAMENDTWVRRELVNRLCLIVEDILNCIEKERTP